MFKGNAMELSEEQMEAIAERAAEKAVAKMTGMMYQEVGRTVVKRFFWFVGLLAVGIIAGMKASGYRFGG